jgi:hypothetical protein
MITLSGHAFTVSIPVAAGDHVWTRRLRRAISSRQTAAPHGSIPYRSFHNHGLGGQLFNPEEEIHNGPSHGQEFASTRAKGDLCG